MQPAPRKAEPAPQAAEPAPKAAPSPTKPAPAPRTAEAAPRTAEAAPKAPAAAAAPPPARKSETRTRRARLYFVSVDNGGGIALREVNRNVEYTDAPLTSTLLALMKGPTPGEGQAGLLSAIPADSRLNEVTVKDGTAYLDFNESFRFNALGEEGLRAQLRQIVWSATEFPNLTRVQFLIEGRQVKYLGPEGTFIGEPLSRQSFR